MLVKRTAGRVLQTLLRQDIRGMPIRKSMLDPHKHNTMNHNLNLRYNDVWDYGKYPDYYLIHSVAPRTYEPKVIETICALIHQLHNVKVLPKDIECRSFRTFKRFFAKDIRVVQDVDSFVSKLLNRLARDIIVRESRYTWPYEQKTRLEKVTQAYTSQRPETIADFLEFYNNEIQTLVLTSNLGFDANIDQEGSYLAKSMSKEEPESACKLDIPADKANIFNSLLLMIHK